MKNLIKYVMTALLLMQLPNSSALYAGEGDEEDSTFTYMPPGAIAPEGVEVSPEITTEEGVVVTADEEMPTTEEELSPTEEPVITEESSMYEGETETGAES